MSAIRYEVVESQLTSLMNNVGRMLLTPMSQLTREDQLGDANFAKARVMFENAIEMMKEITRFPLQEQPPAIVKQVEHGVGVFLAMYNNVQGFNLTPSPQESEKDPIRRRDKILNELRSMFDSAVQSLYPVLGYLRTLHVDVSNEMQESKRKAQDFSQYVEDKQREMLELIENVKKTAQLAGVVTYAGIFGEGRYPILS